MPAEDSAADPIRQAVTEQIDQWLASEDAVRADADDAVHQMRVAIRRIRSLLRAGPNTVGGSAAIAKEIDDDLRWLAGILGMARDAEVLAGRYRAALDRIAPELVRGRAVERLVDAAVAQYRAGWAESLAAMDSPRYRRLRTGLDALVDESSVLPSGDGSPETVQAAYRRVRKATKAAGVAGAGRDDLVAGLIAHGHRHARAVLDEADLARMVKEQARPGDMVVCLGAGSISTWAWGLPAQLEVKAA